MKRHDFSQRPMRVGLVGAGHIAAKMARTISQTPGVETLAVASRSGEKAAAFAAELGIPRAYGSYEAMMDDPDIDLLYIATPHSHHYEPTRQALLRGKACLVEKAFTANAREAEELIRLARQNGTLLVEAVWTRFMPLSHQIGDLIGQGVIGQPKMLTASLCYKIDHKERVMQPSLCGGALLDLGVYLLNFARMYLGTRHERCVSSCQVGPTGVDMQENICLTYASGAMACLQCGALSVHDRRAVISGTEGSIVVDNVNNPTRADLYRGFDLAATYTRPDSCITGYEYEVLECKRCLELGLSESSMMPLHETLDIMRQMDALRREWGVSYPMDGEA